MNKITLETSTTFVVEECCVCGVQFGMTEPTYRYYKKVGSQTTFSCPNGHTQYYSVSSVDEVKELKKALEAEKKRVETLENEARNYAAQLRETSRLNGRGKKECPHCGKCYKGLRLHIKMKHPDVNGDTPLSEPVEGEPVE